MRPLFSLLVVLPVVLCAPLLAAPTTVYRSVDAEGTVTFSDQPPADGAAEALSIDAPPPADPDILEARLEAMRETTARMATDRRAREQARAERSAARERASGSALEGQPRTPVVRTAPLYGWPAYRPPWRPRPPLRPDPVYPPLRPGQSVLPLENNRQLMRPIVSSRR